MDIDDIIVRKLAADELPRIMPLIEKHNAKIEPAELRRRLEVMIPHGYHCIAAFENDRIVGVAGYWLGARFYCGEFMDVDNVVVEESIRSRGIGLKLMDWVHEKSRQLGCKVVVLDSYVTYVGAHKFYFRQGYEILGFHFSRKVD